MVLETADGREARLGCEDMTAVREAAIAGLGVALLPWHVCLQALQAGLAPRCARPDRPFGRQVSWRSDLEFRCVKKR